MNCVLLLLKGNFSGQRQDTLAQKLVVTNDDVALVLGRVLLALMSQICYHFSSDIPLTYISLAV